MARRLFDTDLIQQNWYIELPPKFKALYIHLLSVADIDGVFEVAPRIFSAFIGDEVTKEEVFTVFGDRVKPLGSTKGLLVDFIAFQNGGDKLSSSNAHKAIVRRLHRHGLSLAKYAELSNHHLLCAFEEDKIDAMPLDIYDEAEQSSDEPEPKRGEIKEEAQDARPRRRKPPTLEEVLKVARNGSCRSGGETIPDEFAREWYGIMSDSEWKDMMGYDTLLNWRRKFAYAWADEKKRRRESHLKNDGKTSKTTYQQENYDFSFLKGK